MLQRALRARRALERRSRPLRGASGRGIGPSLSAEREREGLHAWIEKLDPERVVADDAVLPHELIEALSLHHAHALGIDVGAVAHARRGSVDRHPEMDWRGLGSGPQNEMQVAGVKPVFDAAALLIESGALAA